MPSHQELTANDQPAAAGAGLSRAPSERLAAGTRALPVHVIEPPRGWVGLGLAELWRYRDLFSLMVLRDISARYRQSLVGYGWAVLKPIMSMIVFTLIFTRLARVETGGIPYPLFVMSGLVPWMYFAGVLNSSTTSVVGGGALLSKVYFPRLLLPLTSAAVGTIELGIQLCVLAAMMAWYGAAPGWPILLAPVFVLLTMLTALSVGLWLTALNVRYRDVTQAVPFLTQLWMWLSAVIVPTTSAPAALRPWLGLNPMLGMIEGFRWSLLGTASPDWRMLSVSLSVVLVLAIAGLVYFRRTEATFADII